MAKKKRTGSTSPRPLAPILLAWVAGVVVIAVAVLAVTKKAHAPKEIAPPSTNAPLSSTMEINQAMMVTVDLDFGGGRLPTIAEALPQIERRYAPAEGTGRTFAVLDAYGEATPENRLRVSMHVSSEKVGGGSLVFRRTGETLWRGQFTPPAPGKKSPTTGGQNLMIFVNNGAGKLLTIDGSSNPLSVLDATVKELGQPLKDVWPEGEEREVTFLYSSCGCPVKVMSRREGDRTQRTKDLPVIFPDDPTVVTVITALMRW
jgi:hypothetical protein